MKKLAMAMALAVAAAANAGTGLRSGDTVALIGDSITEQSYRVKQWGFYHQLTNAAAECIPGKNVKFIPMGYSGFQVKTWLDMERDSLKRDRWTNYRDPGWNLRDVFSNKVDVVAIFLGMNDILMPTVRIGEETHDKWMEDMRTFVKNLRERCSPRQFVFCTITPLTADKESPKNIVRERLNRRLRILAAEEGALVADYGKAVMELTDEARRIATDMQPVPDFVHPQAMGHTAMALELARTLGESGMADRLSEKYRSELENLAKRVPAQSLALRWKMLGTSQPEDDELVYELSWTARDAKGRMPRVTVKVPEGWTASPSDLCAESATVHLRGAPVSLVNNVEVKANWGTDEAVETAAIPAPWRISAPFDFGAIWSGQNWKTNSVAPVAYENANGWKLLTATWDYTAHAAPGSIDPYQVMFGGNLDSFYAVRWVHSPKARKVAVKFSHKTFSATLGLHLWVNGEHKFAGTMDRRGKNSTETEAELKAGWNELRIRCDHANWQRQFACDLAPLEGDDLGDLKYSWKPVK